MKIELRLYASLASGMPESTGGKPHAMEVSEGTTIQNLLEQLKVPQEKIKLVFLNGVHANGDEILKEGDRVGIFPAVAGG
jgi:sulfur carrier protein ThiS